MINALLCFASHRFAATTYRAETGACRVSAIDTGYGINLYQYTSLLECKVACDTLGVPCVAYEFNARNLYCQLFGQTLSYYNGFNYGNGGRSSDVAYACASGPEREPLRHRALPTTTRPCSARILSAGLRCASHGRRRRASRRGAARLRRLRKTIGSKPGCMARWGEGFITFLISPH